MAKIRLGLCSALSLLMHIGQIFRRFLTSQAWHIHVYVIDCGSRKVAVFIVIMLMRMATCCTIFDQHVPESR